MITAIGVVNEGSLARYSEILMKFMSNKSYSIDETPVFHLVNLSYTN